MASRPRSDPTPINLRPSQPLLTADDVRNELTRIFGTGAGDQLVVTVHGAEGDDAGTVASYDELMSSLDLSGSGSRIATSLVEAPNKEAIERAMRVICRPDVERRLFDQILTLLGRRFVDPLGNMLDATPEGLLMIRLQRLRSQLLEDVGELGLTRETRTILERDLEKLLGDDYLEMLAEHEEGVQRPKVEALAREVLHIIGDAFHQALVKWPAEASRLAESVSRSLDERVELKEVPNILRDCVVSGIEEFLWVETGPFLRERLDALFASHVDVTAAPRPVERADYRPVADACWRMIARLG